MRSTDLDISRLSVAERIQPVGRVEFGGGGSAGGAAARSGEEIVKSTCGNCHIPGVANAPKIGDKAAWAARAKVGLKEMIAVAAKGKGAMPPRAGSSRIMAIRIPDAGVIG